jgi:hypothetical protein
MGNLPVAGYSTFAFFVSNMFHLFLLFVGVPTLLFGLIEVWVHTIEPAERDLDQFPSLLQVIKSYLRTILLPRNGLQHISQLPKVSDLLL